LARWPPPSYHRTMDSLARMRSFAVNNAWSNFRLYRACLALSKEEFDAARTSFFPSIPRTLNHILIVDWYYIDALTAGGSPAPPAPRGTPPR